MQFEEKGLTNHALVGGSETRSCCAQVSSIECRRKVQYQDLKKRLKLVLSKVVAIPPRNVSGYIYKDIK